MSTTYGTRAELRQRIDQRGSQTYTALQDALHDGALEAVSRAVDDWCGQFFFHTTEQARVLTAEWSDRLVVPPLVTISASGLMTDDDADGVYEQTWQASDYVLWPLNAALQEPARPYYEIRVDRRTPSLGLVFPTLEQGVQVTAEWGWPDVPATIREVCLLESQRLLQQMQAPSGIAASQELGEWMVAPELHPTSQMMLMPYRRTGVRMNSAW